MYENPWIYQGKPFTEDDVGDFIGFVYLITDTNTGKLYLGKKILFNKVVKPPLKGKTKRRISKKFSNWQEYYGSNETLNQLVAIGDKLTYKREILHLCRSKSQMSYMESKEIFARDVLLSDLWYNDWVSCRINRRQLSRFSTTV